MKEEFRPKSEWYGKGKDLEEVLDEMDRRHGTVKERYAPWSNPAEALYDRILVALGEGVDYFKDEEQHEVFRTISWAFPVIAFQRFSLQEQLTFFERYKNRKHFYFGKNAKIIELTPTQAQTLSRVASRVDIEFNPNQVIVPFKILDEFNIRRFRLS